MKLLKKLNIFRFSTSLVQKGIAIDKANRQNKALGKLVSGKKSERQEKNPQASMTQEEFAKKKTEQAEKRKASKNNRCV